MRAVLKERSGVIDEFFLRVGFGLVVTSLALASLPR